jgi:hypothetical protein
MRYEKRRVSAAFFWDFDMNGIKDFDVCKHFWHKAPAFASEAGLSPVEKPGFHE